MGLGFKDRGKGLRRSFRFANTLLYNRPIMCVIVTPDWSRLTIPDLSIEQPWPEHQNPFLPQPVETYAHNCTP